ncbi:MAG: zinc ABC transporter substrate-binding protein [Calditerrivibrio sp.]|nr:zinc ABC transporter substrate-binding protein [Calditerrivibrio sp.]
MKKFLILFMIFLGFSVLSQAADRSVAVTILPQKFITEKIAEDQWKVVEIIPKGANVHTYEPKISLLKEVANATAYFSLEETLDEVWLRKLLSLNSKLPVVRVDKGIEKLRMEDHQHGKAKGKLHHDPHIWLSVDNMIKIVENTRDAFIQLDQANKTVYEKRSNDLIKEIKALKEEALQKMNTKVNKNFLVFHPAWGYFARDYNLNQISVEVEGKEPSPKEFAKVIDIAKKHGIKVIFVQPQISAKTVESLSREIGAEIIKIDPLKYEWTENMREVSLKIADALR